MYSGTASHMACTEQMLFGSLSQADGGFIQEKITRIPEANWGFASRRRTRGGIEGSCGFSCVWQGGFLCQNDNFYLKLMVLVFFYILQGIRLYPEIFGFVSGYGLAVNPDAGFKQTVHIPCRVNAVF